MPFTTYILYSASLDRYYTGSCEDINIRLNQHNSARNASTKTGIPWVVNYTKSFDSRSEALSREREIKKKSRKYIEWLINTAG